MLHLIKVGDTIINLDRVCSASITPDKEIVTIEWEETEFEIYDDEARQVWQYLSDCCIFTTKNTAAIQAEVERELSELTTFNAGDVEYSGNPETVK